MPATSTTRPVRYVAREPATSPSWDASSVPPPKLWGEPFGVLLVEDDEDEIAMVQRTIKRAGLTDHPQILRDGRAALDALLGPNHYAAFPSPLLEVPDVILLDLGLPKVSGLDVLRQLKGNARVADIPVVVLSGADDEGTAQVCMNLGADMYLTKPLSHVQALNVIVAVQRHWLAAENFRRWAVELSARHAA